MATSLSALNFVERLLGGAQAGVNRLQQVQSSMPPMLLEALQLKEGQRQADMGAKAAAQKAEQDALFKALGLQMEEGRLNVSQRNAATRETRLKALLDRQGKKNEFGLTASQANALAKEYEDRQVDYRKKLQAHQAYLGQTEDMQALLRQLAPGVEIAPTPIPTKDEFLSGRVETLKSIDKMFNIEDLSSASDEVLLLFDALLSQ